MNIVTEAWTTEEPDRIGAADEVQIAARGPDGSYDPYTTIWVVRAGEDLYVRSWRGSRGRWYRHALTAGAGRGRAAGIERDVAFTQPGAAPHEDLDRGDRAKYPRPDPASAD